MNQALIKLTDERINDNNSLVAFVERAKAVTIPLFPQTVGFIDPALKFGVALVSVNTQLDNYGNNQDIYKNETGGYCLHLSKLNEIAQQAGIQIKSSRPIDRRTDEQGRITLVIHEVTGIMKSIDGSTKMLTTTGKYDYYRDKEKFIKPGEIDRNGNIKGEGQVKGRRSHAEALAESNAMYRLFNKLLAKIPTSFPLEELKKPFAIPYVIEDKNEIINSLPPEEQKILRMELAKKRLGIASSVYGNEEQIQKQVQETNIQVLTDDEEDEEETTSSGLTLTEQNHENAESFRGAPVTERVKKILELINKKGYKHPKGIIPTAQIIEKTPLERQIQLIEELLNMPDEEVTL